MRSDVINTALKFFFLYGHLNLYMLIEFGNTDYENNLKHGICLQIFTYITVMSSCRGFLLIDCGVLHVCILIICFPAMVRP